MEEPTGVLSLVSNLGAAGGVVVVVVYFLRHIAEQSRLNREAAAMALSRFEAMEKAHRESSVLNAQRVREISEEFRGETRHCVEGLIKLNREAAEAMGRVASRVDALVQAVSKKPRGQHGEEGQGGGGLHPGAAPR